jgi:N-acetylglucosaminyl-diphospho-decaprenol L-rhamnosyltransferase
VKLAIVIVHYNTSADLERCLDSLAAHPPSCEHAVVVVDNASSDSGLAAVQQRFADVHWILNSENIGYARGANRGMAAVSADYYLILNPDIQVRPGAVDALLAFAAAHPKAGIVGPQLLNEDGSIQDSCRRFYTFRTLLLRRTFLGKLFPNSRSVEQHLMRDFDHRSARPVDWVLGGCLLVRREALSRTGPMDERFFLYFEDVDWCYRMWQAGFEVYYTPEARFVHSHRRDSARGALHRHFWLHLGSLISFYEKWGLLVYLLKKWRGPLSLLLLWAVDMVALGLAFLGAYGLRSLANPLFTEPLFPLGEYRPLLLFAALLTTVTFLLAGRYRLGRRRGLAAMLHLKQIGTVSLLLLASSYLSHQQVYSRAVLLIFVPLFGLTTALGEDLFRVLRRRMERGYLSLERTLLVGEPDVLDAWVTRVRDLRQHGIDPVGYTTTGGGTSPGPPLARGEVPWLGHRADILAVVARYRISQVVFWDQPRADAAEVALLAHLRGRRIRLRWRIDEAWLLVAGARAESFGGEVSGVLEPGGGSLLAAALGRLTDLLAGLVLVVLAALPYLVLRLLSGAKRLRVLTCRDRWGEPLLLSLVCRADGRLLPLCWQAPLAGALLRGRVGLLGPRLQPAAEAVAPAVSVAEFWWKGGVRPGLTGGWAATREPGAGPSFSFGATSSIMVDVIKQLLLDPGGLGRVPAGGGDSPPESDETRSPREVP